MIPNHEFSDDLCSHYFNHAAMAPWPRRTAEAVAEFARENQDLGPARYREWIRQERFLRGQLAELLGAERRDIALLKNTTEGICNVAWGVDWKAGDNVVSPAEEFPSNRLPWEAQAEHGVELRTVDIRTADDPEQALLDAMNDRTRVLTVSAVQWTDGFRLDLEKLGEGCRASGALFFVDAIQQLGALALDVKRCRIDCLAADAHKWLLGPEGIAVFYCGETAREQLRLQQQGWYMYDNPWNFDAQDPDPSASAKRFEAGSPNNLGQVAMSASLSLLAEWGMDGVSRRVESNSRHLMNELGGIPGIQLMGTSDPSRISGIVSFRSRNYESSKIFRALQAAGFTTALRGGNIRVSPHFYQGPDELDVLIEEITKQVS